MTRPVQEPTDARQFSHFGFRTNQLERRPSLTGARGRFTIKVFSDTTVVTTGDGKFIFGIPEDLDGADLVQVGAYVTTVSSSGLVTVQIRNFSQSADMLSTRITIDASERDSKTAATPAVIDLANDDVVWANQIAIDVDTAGTGAMGLGVHLSFG
jgi:hypothetical protein